MPRQRSIAAGGWYIVRSVLAKGNKAKVIRRQYWRERGTRNGGMGSGKGPLTKAQAEAVKDMTRSMLFNSDKNVAKLSSEVKALSKRAIFSKDVLQKELLKHNESAKIGSFKYSFAIFAGVGSVLFSTVAIALAMQR